MVRSKEGEQAEMPRGREGTGASSCERTVRSLKEGGVFFLRFLVSEQAFPAATERREKSRGLATIAALEHRRALESNSVDAAEVFAERLHLLSEQPSINLRPTFERPPL